jgi:hypothetical protein
VVEIQYEAFEPGGPQPRAVGPAWLVNSRLDPFIASVRAVTERFPFDSGVTGKDRRGEEDWKARQDRIYKEWDQAVEELEETLHRIDPAAVSPLSGAFWVAFLGDVGMGTYYSEYWLNQPDC